LYDIELPIGESEGSTNSTIETYGNINHCSFDGNSHPLLNKNLDDFNDVIFTSNNGGFYLEKYLRIIDKPPVDTLSKKANPMSPGQPKEHVAIPNFITNRDENILRDVVNINSFKAFLNNNLDNIPQEINISDWFGDVSQSEKDKAANRYSGSIGIKFGVRICMIPNARFSETFKVEDTDKDTILTARREKSYVFTKLESEENILDSSFRYSIPIASYEQDVSDVKLATLANANDNLNEELKCYVDKLVETKEFKLFFDKILNVKKIPSILACYSNINFIPSLGLGDNERQEPDLGGLSFFDLDIDDTPDDDDRGNSFNDCKSEIRKLFIAAYKQSDFVVPDTDSNGFDLTMFFRDALNRTYNYLELDKTIPWHYRKRIKSDGARPKDKDGNECENAFAKLFKL